MTCLDIAWGGLMILGNQFKEQRERRYAHLYAYLHVKLPEAG
jgi:hypothetical protein